MISDGQAGHRPRLAGAASSGRPTWNVCLWFVCPRRRVCVRLCVCRTHVCPSAHLRCVSALGPCVLLSVSAPVAVCSVHVSVCGVSGVSSDCIRAGRCAAQVWCLCQGLGHVCGVLLRELSVLCVSAVYAPVSVVGVSVFL